MAARARNYADSLLSNRICRKRPESACPLAYLAQLKPETMEAWALVAPFLAPAELFQLLALSRAFSRSPLRHQLLARTTWRVPPTPLAAERALRTFSAAALVRRAAIHAQWQQRFLARLPGLEWLMVEGFTGDAAAFALSEQLPTSIRFLRVAELVSVDLANAKRLENLEEIELASVAVKNAEALAKLPRLRRLSTDNVWHEQRFAFVADLRGLRVLEVANGDFDTEVLKALPLLEELSLRSCEIESLDALRAVAPRLKALDLEGSLLDDYEVGRAEKDAFVASLVSVERLNLRGTDFESTERNLTPIANLTRLRVLQLSEHFDDLSPLAGLVNLEELSLLGSQDADWGPIAGLTKLRSVDQFNDITNWNESSTRALQRLPLLTKLEGATKLAAAFPLKHLREIHFGVHGSELAVLEAGCYPGVDKVETSGLVDLASVVRCFPNVRSLYVSSFQSDTVDLRPIAFLPGLTELRIGCDSSINDNFAFLKPLVNLELLHMYSQPIEDLSVLRGKKKLRVLWLERSSIHDITVLAELLDLREVRLRETSVTDVSCLRGHPHMRTLLLPQKANATVLLEESGIALPNVIHMTCGCDTVWPPLNVT